MNLKVSSCLYKYARFELVWILLLSSCMPVTITSSPTGYSEEKLSTPGALSAQEKKVETPAASTQLPMVTRIAQALTSSATPELQEDLYTLSVIPDSLRWDPAGSLLVYSTNDGRIWFRTKKEGSARPIVGIQVAPPARLSTAWSPDGDKLIIYGVWGENYPQWTGMWLASISNKEGSQAKQIIPPTMPEPPVYQNEGVIYTASWAPDGKRIAYSFKGEAWIYDLESGLHVQITHVTTDPIIREGQFEPFDGAREVYFSPDGNFLALGLTCNCPSPFSGVAVVNLDSREPKLMSAGRLTGWTIDSTLIIFEMSSGDWDKEYTFDVYGANPGNGKITNLTVSNPGFDMLLVVCQS